jgi:hypothetical protein
MSKKVGREITRGWNWTLWQNDDGTFPYEQAQLSVLMDIREELKRLNNVLQCPNFIAVPTKLDQIAKNTRKRRKPKVVGKPKLRVVR